MIAMRQAFENPDETAETQPCCREARAMRSVGRWISSKPSHVHTESTVEPAP